MTLWTIAPGDAAEIKRIFQSTFVLGRPLPDLPDFDAYADFSLDWYLNEAREDARVMVQGGEVVGYVLVCTREDDLRAWQRQAARTYLRKVVPKIVLRRYPKDADRFYRERIVDGFYLWRDGPYIRLNTQDELRAHAHFNLAAGARGRLIIRDFVAHIDETCRRRGIHSWIGEMNARKGRRATVLERYGAQIIDRRTNLTLSWLAGEPVERLTVVRKVGPIERVDQRQELPETV